MVNHVVDAIKNYTFRHPIIVMFDPDDISENKIEQMKKEFEKFGLKN